MVLERTNARYLASLPEPISFVTIDVSFISLDLILPIAAKLLCEGGWCVPLIKPQFEAGRHEVGSRGVVRSPATHRKVLEKVLSRAVDEGFAVTGLTRSPLRGPEGNVEFLAALRPQSSGAKGDHNAAIAAMIDGVVPA
jgi:23S rRNA (cytidine1920-2'-O)/16S rRNA (cytidine1409-2'-O)-methyltransferase